MIEQYVFVKNGDTILEELELFLFLNQVEKMDADDILEDIRKTMFFRIKNR